jgi:type I restriction-modification system DNA methylase subunit
MFFLEAKKPSVHINDDAESAAQIRRYGWSAGLPVSILTNFDHFAVYDCSVKPKETDKPGAGRIKQLNYHEYISEFNLIWDTFSRERVQQGGLDKYVQNDGNKKGTSTVDKDFLGTLDKWRILLAKNISANNKINEDELNYIVQNTIDRLIFLRIAEDRHLEQYGQLREAIKSGDYYANILNVFKTADQKYNSSLFDFKKDSVSEKASIDNKTIKSIIAELYPPSCPYEFSVMAVEILGSAYERFLGKQILLSKNGRAVIEEKPEIRKAGGVYYTPQYVVDYIVKNTVGKLIEDMNPDNVSAVKIVDPACGSGSFLLGAYQYLLDWHKDFYNLNKKQNRGKKGSPLTPTGELTTAAKKHILTNNIYGVDLDANAVEVTKLSLLLKCLEGETKESIEAQTRLFHDRILPDLDNNIKSGNSLIDLDYYDNDMDFGDERKVKPFSWHKAFPETFKQGGFDCVIGNPPYGADYGNKIKHYLASKYELSITIADTYLMFLRRAFHLAKEEGLISYIIPSTWLYMSQFNTVRKDILKEKVIYEIQLFRKPVFEKVTVEICTLIIRNCIPNDKTKYVFKEIKDEPHLFLSENHIQNQLGVLECDATNLILSNKKDQKLFEKIKNDNPELRQLTLIVCGLTPYRLGKGNPPQSNKLVKEKAFDADYKKDNTYRQCLMGRDFNKYAWCIQKERWISYGNWLAEPRFKAPFDDEKKIIIRQTSDRLIAHLDTNKYLSLKNVHNLRIINAELAYEYLLGLLNSKLLDWWYQKLIPEKGRVFAEVKIVNLVKLPIKVTSKEQQNQIIKYVEQLLQLNKDLQEATLPNQKEQFNAKIGYHEDQINMLVYQLYGLTDEEIKIIEGD